MSKLALLLLGGLPLWTGCAPPTQYGGPIVIDQAGLKSRLTILCRLQARSSSPSWQGRCHQGKAGK